MASKAKIHFIGALAVAHTSVKRAAWQNGEQIMVRSLWKAAQDPDPYVATTAAKVLLAIAPVPEDLRSVFGTDPTVAPAEAQQAHKKLWDLVHGADYFPRIADLVRRAETWRSLPAEPQEN